MISGTAMTVFVLATVWVVYAYAGYPLLLLIVRAFRGTAVSEARPCDESLPRLTVIVAVHNGASQIRGRLANLLEQDYPRELVEIIVSDDASDDETASIVTGEYGPWGVRLVSAPARGGKERAQKRAVELATGEIFVFTDVGARSDRDGLRQIVRPFSDPTVGCVSSVDKVGGEEGRESGEGLYVRYEMALRRLESEVSSLVGVSGSFFAVRGTLCSDFSETLPSDFRCVLVAVRAGLRAVPAEQAYGYYADITAGAASRQRRVRTIVRGLSALWAERRMLDPLRFGLFAWQLASHKLARWSVPFALLLALVSSTWLAPRFPFFAAILALQLIGYAYGAILLGGRRPPASRIGRIVRYLAEANLAALIAWIRFARGDRFVDWKPTSR